MIGQQSLFSQTQLKLRNRVELVQASASEVRTIFTTRHYLKRARSSAQINYLVLIDGVVDGAITYAYPMMSAPLLGVESDEMIEFARLYLASNIPHTASCAISKSLRVIASDWIGKHSTAKPVKLVVSWSDTTRHAGTVYKAANFQWVRRTKSAVHGNKSTSKRGARRQHLDYQHEKDCWVYWLR